MARTAPPSRLPLVATAAGAVLATAALMPASSHQLGPTVSFMPAMIAVVAGFDLMSVYLLVGDYRDRGDARILAMACAYSWSLVVMAGYALAFPGAVASHPPLALVPSMAPYYYIAWHAGFPCLLGAAWAPWPSSWTKPTPPSRRGSTALALVGAATLAGAGVVVGLAAAAHRLPVLINGVDTSRMTTLTAPVTVPLVAAALVASLRGTRRRTGPERWSSVAVLVCLCDLVLTYYSRHRFSVGWYGGRSLTLVAAAVVLLAMLASFRRLKAQAEHDAAVDALTGLQNRRGAQATLDRMVARARRSGAPLGAVSFDLDWFKLVNDRHGHEAGDDVLAEVGRLTLAACRLGDAVARVGGEEFLILLPDTDADGAQVVAEKIRRIVATMVVPSVREPVTASLGVTVLDGRDPDGAAMLRRADGALYEAKRRGRNRVETSLVPGPLSSAYEGSRAAAGARGGGTA